jgi:hypothetical protein
VQLGRATIGPSDPASALLGRSIWRPFRARRSWWTIPRVEPGLSSVALRGTKQRPQPKDCGAAAFRSKIIPSLIFAPFGPVPNFSVLSLFSENIAVMRCRVPPSLFDRGVSENQGQGTILIFLFCNSCNFSDECFRDRSNVGPNVKTLPTSTENRGRGRRRRTRTIFWLLAPDSFGKHRFSENQAPEHDSGFSFCNSCNS